MSTGIGQTSLHKNPFWILGVTVRDDRRRIVERAEERSLHLDHDECQKARLQLTTPRTRLAAEVGWMPGVSPNRAEQLAARLLNDPLSIRSENGLPPLAHANLLVSAFETLGEFTAPTDVATSIQQLALLLDHLDPEMIRRDINEDRGVSGFPQLLDNAHVGEELAARKREALSSLRRTLDRMRTESLVEAITMAVEIATQAGSSHAPELIDELVDRYSVEAHEFLEKEAANIDKLLDAARTAAKTGHRALYKIIENIETVARNWDRIAQPIQLSARARGIDHEPSAELGVKIRNLAISLNNEHDLVAEAKQLTKLVQEVFAELPVLAERVEEDASALQTISTERKAWEEGIGFEAEVGTVFKNTLRMSPEGITWKGRTYPLEAITRVRWGGVKHSLNGIPTGTTYTIAFGDTQNESVVETRREDVYSPFLEKLWRGVGVRLSMELVQALKAGNTVYFGDVAVADDYVELKRHKVLRSADPVKKQWQEVQIWNADGSFCIGAQEDKNTYVNLSYIHVPNVHILEHIIRIGFKQGVNRLSDLLQSG